MSMPLDGVRVLDWSQWQAGPIASTMLADLGADVIKIEEPSGGDPARGVTRITGLATTTTGRNAYFEGNNRNKRSITLNLRSKEGQRLAYQLVEKSDIFLHNFRESTAEKFGLDYETLRSHNPNLIYAVGTGLGSEGPDSDDAAFDLIGMARSGFMTVVGEPGPPMTVGGGICDQSMAIMLAYGVLAALLARDRIGKGQRVEASLLSGMTWLQQSNINMKLIGGLPYPKWARAQPSQPLWNHYCCRDGKWLVLAHLQAQRYWPNVCRAMNMDDLANDPRFDSIESRRENSSALVAVMDQIFATKDRSEWLEVFRAHGVISAAVNDVDELVCDPQMLANEYITEFDHPFWGKIQTVGVPIKLSETPGRLRKEAPEHGQHTEEVLIEILGYGWDEILRLRELNAI